jgi:protein required for attachment to host cells
MSHTWIVVANSAEARILEPGARRYPLRVKATFVNPEARAHEGDLITDGGAAVLQRMGQGQRRYTGPQVTAKEHSCDLFARQLADALMQARLSNSYDDLVLIASPELLGKLRAALDQSTTRCVRLEIDKNLAHLPPDKLDRSLQALLYP